MLLKLFVSIGGILAFLGVALGAFGTHSLENVLTGKWKGIYETGVQYHLIHALGLVFIGLLAGRLAGGALFQWAGWLMVAGVVLFSGSLYVMSITKIGGVGAITPIGGVAFLASWLLVIIAVLRG